jgi:molybdopterin/thiamine biosynthesis adenylyltransferase
MILTRQQGIVDPKLLKDRCVTVIGVGGIGSFSALCLGKMGVDRMELYDEDGVSPENLPNQFFRTDDVKEFKVNALRQILNEFTDTGVYAVNQKYIKQRLSETVIVATDSMPSRRLVWEQFLKQKQAKFLIEARMGAELGMVFTLRKDSKPWKKDCAYYESRLYSEKTVKPLPCTAKSIIYNVLTIAGAICRAYKGLITDTPVPKEQDFNMTSLDERYYMFTP